MHSSLQQLSTNIRFPGLGTEIKTVKRIDHSVMILRSNNEELAEDLNAIELALNSCPGERCRNSNPVYFIIHMTIKLYREVMYPS